MSDENKPVETKTFEPWEKDERQGLVEMMALTMTVVYADSQRMRAVTQGAVAHLRETHGFTEDKAREELIRVQADSLRLIAKSIIEGADMYGGGEALLNGTLAKGSEKGN